jgi:hypothetical protein
MRKRGHDWLIRIDESDPKIACLRERLTLVAKTAEFCTVEDELSFSGLMLEARGDRGPRRLSMRYTVGNVASRPL